MVTVQKTRGGYELVIEGEPPSIYLDHWALRRFGENQFLRDRLLSAFRTRGTLMFSLMNLIEIGRDLEPSRGTEIRSLLEAIGPHWVPMTIDPLRIIKAESGEVNEYGDHPCFARAVISEPSFARRLIQDGPSLVHAVDIVLSTDGDELSEDAEKKVATLQGHLDDWRAAYRLDRNSLNDMFPKKPIDAAAPMRGIYHRLVRSVVTPRDLVLDDNHTRDLLHAITSSRCADLVTLDRHWASQVRNLKLEGRVFHQSQLPDFLNALESYPSVR